MSSSPLSPPNDPKIGDAMVKAVVDGNEAYLNNNKGGVNMISDEGYTPLYAACMRGAQPSLVQLLLRNGAKVDLKGSDRETPLYIAVFNNNTELVKLLLAAGADVNAENGKENETALHVASKFGYCDLLQLLLKSGANINARTCRMETPLFLAAKNGKHEAAYYLLMNNANANLSNEDGKSPLYIASEKQLKHCVIVLKAEPKFLKEAKSEADVELKMRRPSVPSSEELEAKALEAKKREHEAEVAAAAAAAAAAPPAKAPSSKSAAVSSSNAPHHPAGGKHKAHHGSGPSTAHHASKPAAATSARTQSTSAPAQPPLEKIEIIPIDIPKNVIRDHDPITGEKYGPCRTLVEVGYDEPRPIPAGLALKPVERPRYGGTSMVVGTGTEQAVVPKTISVLPDDDTVDYGVIMPKSRKQPSS